MTKLILTNHTDVAIVDDEDFDRLSTFKWYSSGTSIYRIVNRNTYTIHIALASEIMNQTNKMFDHRDRNYLNNQKYNLRLTTYSQNGMNRTKKKRATSKYKGVTLYTRNSYPCWDANIRFNNRLVYLGRFKVEEEAAKAYDTKAKELFGEFANLNF